MDDRGLTSRIMQEIAFSLQNNSSDITELGLFSMHYRKSLRELRRAGRVLIFGAGEFGRRLMGDIIRYHIAEIVGFCDNNQLIQGHVINGIKVFLPEELFQISKDAMIAITPKQYFNEIFRQLDGLGFPLDKVMVVDVENRWRRE